jgi:hypothetical protein
MSGSTSGERATLRMLPARQPCDGYRSACHRVANWNPGSHQARPLSDSQIWPRVIPSHGSSGNGLASKKWTRHFTHSRQLPPTDRILISHQRIATRERWMDGSDGSEYEECCIEQLDFAETAGSGCLGKIPAGRFEPPRAGCQALRHAGDG